jgi:bifunctional DNA-binding transcriptional regulator/antitoxin component of YhaV-PrlF toxin-antitoxin module
MALRGETMIKTKIEPNYRITIPEALRPSLKVGDELLITTDPAGRIIITPEARIHSILERTAGMWQGRQDIPADGVQYVNQLRQARRLRELGVLPDGD